MSAQVGRGGESEQKHALATEGAAPDGKRACAFGRASNSSMQMMHGAPSLRESARACLNRSRTARVLTPAMLELTMSAAVTAMNETRASPASARASSVLPQPGGPSSSTPRGQRAPTRSKRCGSRR